MFLPDSYPGAVRAAGGVPVLLPPPPDRGEQIAPAQIVARLDALMLAGGADLDPGSYGGHADAAIGPTWPGRDRFELELAREAVGRDLPTLAICRGMQVLNVALGGTIAPHLPDGVGDDHHLQRAGVFSDHGVRLEPGSLAARAAGGERVDVKSHHHQGVAELGADLVASGWDADGTIEAIELPACEFGLGVLWHPEEDSASPVVAALVEAAR